MKRYIRLAVTAVFLAIAFLISACAKDDIAVPYGNNDINAALLTWENDGCVYEAKITLNGEVPEDLSRNRASTVTFTSPKEIEGLTVKYSPVGGDVSVGGVAYALSGDMGRELYRIVHLFSLSSEDMSEKKVSDNKFLAKYNVNMDGCDVNYEVSFVDGIPVSAGITWSEEEIKVLSITPCE